MNLVQLIQGWLQVAISFFSKRTNIDFESTVVLNKDSGQFLKTSANVTLPNSSTLKNFQQGNNPPRTVAWSEWIYFTAAGINVFYFDGSLAYTSVKAGQLIRAQLISDTPLNNGTFKFIEEFELNDLSSVLSWKNDVQTCGLVQPISPVIGQRFLNLTTNQIEVWNGSAWIVEPTNQSDAVKCETITNGIYIKTGATWTLFSFEASTQGLGITIISNVVATDNGDGLTYVGNKNTVLADPTGPITVSPLGVNIAFDNKTIQVVGGQLAKKSYTQNFNSTTDWTPAGTDAIIVIAQSIHQKGINPQWTLYGSSGEQTFAYTQRTAGVGDITITVPLSPVDGRFIGSIDID